MKLLVELEEDGPVSQEYVRAAVARAIHHWRTNVGLSHDDDEGSIGETTVSLLPDDEDVQPVAEPNTTESLLDRNLQIWPFGHGAVLTGAGVDAVAGKLFIVAVPDDYIGTTGDVGSEDLMKRLLLSETQKCILDFPTQASVDNFIFQLRQVREQLPEEHPDVQP